MSKHQAIIELRKMRQARIDQAAAINSRRRMNDNERAAWAAQCEREVAAIDLAVKALR